METERPALGRNLDSKTFREYYWLKEELTAFCREIHLPVSGGKQEIAERIALFLDTGEIMQSTVQRNRKPMPEVPMMTPFQHTLTFSGRRRKGKRSSGSSLSTIHISGISLRTMPGRA